MKINTDLIYPIGSIYISVNSINPSLLFGGTWEAIKGRFLLGGGKPSQNTNLNHGAISNDELNWDFVYGHTIGEYRHQLTISEMPSHSHSVRYLKQTAGNDYQFCAGVGAWQTTGITNNNIESTGGNLVHNNIPPCLVVYMWKRTA